MVDQRRHGRIETIALNQLQFQAFRHAGRHDAGRLEALADAENLLHRVSSQPRRTEIFEQRGAHVAGIVDRVDQDLGDGHFGRRKMGDQRLVHQVFGQGLFAAQRPLQAVLVAVEPAAALAGLGPVDHRAFGGVGRGAVLFANRRAVVVAIDIGARDIEVVIGRNGVAVAEFQLAAVFGSPWRGSIGLGFADRVDVVALQQRIALQLGFDDGFELKIGQLQQLDRLLQLGRDDEPLPLFEFQPLPECHVRRKSKKYRLICGMFSLIFAWSRKPRLGICRPAVLTPGGRFRQDRTRRTSGSCVIWCAVPSNRTSPEWMIEAPIDDFQRFAGRCDR